MSGEPLAKTTELEPLSPERESSNAKGTKGGRPRLFSLRSGIIKGKLLEGVSEHYCRHFARTEWGVTSACARRYVHFAKKLIGVESKPFTQDIFLDHLAMRRHLRTVAFSAKDYKLVSEILKDEAALLALYDVKKKPQSDQQAEQKKTIIEEILTSPSSAKLLNQTDEPDAVVTT